MAEDTDIYECIKQAASRSGVTLAALAERIGVSRQALNSSMKSPSYPTLQKIADALGLKIWQLMATPDEIRDEMGMNKGSDFIAIILNGKTCYRAFSLDKLREIVDRLTAEAAK